jgi:hypothetical protein
MQDCLGEVAYQAVTFRVWREIREKFIGDCGQEHMRSFCRVVTSRLGFTDSGRASNKSLFEKRVEPGLHDRFVNFRFGTAGRHAADRFAVNLDGQPALVRKKIRER